MAYFVAYDRDNDSSIFWSLRLTTDKFKQDVQNASDYATKQLETSGKGANKGFIRGFKDFAKEFKAGLRQGLRAGVDQATKQGTASGKAFTRAYEDALKDMKLAKPAGLLGGPVWNGGAVEQSLGATEALGVAAAVVAVKLGKVAIAIKALKTVAKPVWAAIKLGFKACFEVIRQVGTAVLGGLKKTLGAVIGVIKTGIKTAIAWGKEGFSNLTKAGGETKANMDQLRGSIMTLKNALGSIAAPIFNAVAPALNALIKMLATAATAVAKFMSALTGREFAVVATNIDSIGTSAGGAGSAMGGAAKNAKELKRQLMGFDQIQKLDDITDSLSGGGSGGGSGSLINPNDMFSMVETGHAANKWAELVKQSWAEADFTSLGTIVGNKLAEALDKIPWDKIKAKTGQVGSSLATALNGINKSDFFPTLGTTIGNALNAALEFAYQLVTKFDFKQFAVSIGTGINNAVSTFDWSKLGATLGGFVSGIFTTLNNFFKTTDWGQLGSKVMETIKSFFANISWSDVGGAVGGVPQAIMGALKGAIDNVNWRELPSKVFGAIKDFVIGFDFGEFAKSAWDLLGSALRAALDVAKGLLDVGKDIVDKLKEGIKEKWGDFSDWVSGKVKGLAAIIEHPIEFGKSLASGELDAFFEKYGALENKTVTLEAHGKPDKPYLDMAKTYPAIKSETATKTVKASGNINSAKKDWNSVKTETVTKRLASGGYTEGYKNLRKNFFDFKSNTATKRLASAGRTEGYNNLRKNFFDFKSNTATKTVKGSQEKSFTNAKSSYDAFKSNSATVTLKAQTTKAYRQAVDNHNSMTGSSISYSKIPSAQYAEGGKPKLGTLFWAGEAGPEIVAHARGGTEVMNMSQIASVMSSTIRSVMYGMQPPQLSFVDRQRATQGESTQDGAVIKLLSAILTAVQTKDSDVYFDGTKITNEVVKNINREIRATGISPILY